MLSDDYEVKVLDRGYVKYIDSMGDDSTIIEAARMSTGKGFEGWNPEDKCEVCGIMKWETQPTTCGMLRTSHRWKATKGDAQLLDYLYRHHHSTPFEMCELAIEVQAPIMVFREWHRSRTQSYNEFSGRYSKMLDLHYIPEASRIQKQSSSNNQSSEGDMPEVSANHIRAAFEKEQSEVYRNYNLMLENGVAKEIARLNTPVARYSRMRAKTDLRNWLHFLNLRMRPNAQYEIRVYAEAVAGIIKELWPRTWALFERETLRGVSFSSEDMAALREIIQGQSKLEAATTHIKSPSRVKEFLDKLEKGGLEIL